MVERNVVEVEPSGIKITKVIVANTLGNVIIEGHDRPTIKIIAVKRAPDQATLERLKVSLIPDPAGPVTISTALIAGKESRPIAAGSIRIDLTVFIPRSAGVSASVWNGSLAVKSVDNGAELRSNEGDIQVEHVSGDISSETASGRLTISEVYGVIDAQSVDGDMQLEIVRGRRLAATAHNGSITASKVRSRHVSIITTSGDIKLSATAIAGGSYRVWSYRGNIEVRFGAGTYLEVHARSRKGTVKMAKEFRPQVDDSGRVTGYLGRGRSPVDVQLSSRLGTVTVAKF